jgi:hypothetical protein
MVVEALGCAGLVVDLVGGLTADATCGDQPLAHPPVTSEDAGTDAVPAFGQWR